MTFLISRPGSPSVLTNMICSIEQHVNWIKNIPGKPQVFMPLVGFPAYVDKCEQVAADGYEGFQLRGEWA